MKSALIALLALSSAPVLAQTGAPGETAPPATLSASGPADWSGFYGGISFGGSDGSYQLGVSRLDLDAPSVSVDGVILGQRIGQNWSRGRSVFGWDFDLTTGPEGTAPQGTLGRDISCTTGACNVSIGPLITFRGRYGLLVNPETLVYGAAGVAVAAVEGGIENSAQQGDSTATGYTVGVGVERMVFDRVTLYGEVSHVDLGTLDFGTGSGTQTFGADGSFDTFKLGVNFRF